MSISKLDKTLAEINKKFGVGTIGRICDMPTIKAERISSGSPYLDYCMGGGFPLGRSVELFGQFSCIDKDTFIGYLVVNNNGKTQNHKGGTIENLYKRFHGEKRLGKGFYQRPQTLNSSFFIISVNTENYVVKNQIIDVVRTGRKECYQIITKGGKFLIVTPEHRFLTQNNEYKKLENLKVGEFIYVQNNVRLKRKHKIIRYKEVFVKYHPKWKTKKVDKYIYYRGRVSHAKIEALLNNIPYEEYISILNKGEEHKDFVDKMNFIPDDSIVHHKNHNPLDDRIENLELVKKENHECYHGIQNHRRGIFGIRVTEDKIVSIKPVGIRETYDIKCLSPFNNYIANGIVVHNSGKSLIALRTIIEAQKKGLQCVYLDSENAFSPEFASRLGVDVNKLIISQISAGEAVFDIIDKLLQADVAVIVIDSVASLVPSYELEEEIGKQTMALQARLMSKALRKLTAKAAKNKTLLLFVNQIREKVGAYGNPEITSGGRALGFYASLRVEVRKGDFLKEQDRIIGQVVKFKVVKSKVCPPYRDGYFNFYHPTEDNKDLDLFDTANELVSMLLVNRKIARRGSYYDILGRTFQGREQLEEEIKEDKKFKDKLVKLSLE